MLKTARAAFAALILACAMVLAGPLTAAAPTGKPEDVGLSTERLKRVAELVQRHIAAGSFSGAVTLVARNGRIALPRGVRRRWTSRRRSRWSRTASSAIMSMTKPVIGVAILMMMEEGKVRLQDPVSKFIPEWKDMTVACRCRRAPGARAGGSGAGGQGGGPPEPALLHRADRARGPDSRPADAYLGRRQRHDQQLRQSRSRGGTEGHARRLHPATRQSAAGVPARARAGPTARPPASTCCRAIVEVASGMPIDRFVKTAHLRSARDEGHHATSSPPATRGS